MAEVDRTEGQAARAFARGDEQGLRAAYDAHGSLVYTYCRRRLDDSLAREVTQDVFLSAWKARDRFDPNKGSLAAWLLGIAKNRLIDRVRAEQRHSLRRADAEVGELPVESDLERIGDRMLVADALSLLPERTADILRLAYGQGLTQREIAERKDLPIGTVKSDVRRGLARIRDHLESAHD